MCIRDRIYVEDNKPSIGKVIFRYDRKLIRNRQKIYEINTIFKTCGRRKLIQVAREKIKKKIVDFKNNKNCFEKTERDEIKKPKNNLLNRNIRNYQIRL